MSFYVEFNPPRLNIDTGTQIARGGGSGGGEISNELKEALLQMAEKVAYIDANGQDYYQDLYYALYPIVSDYTISNVLTNVVNSNTSSTISAGGSYTATLSCAQNYEITTVTITMGGNDVTGTAYAGGTISIPNVTGNIVITAVATQLTLSSISCVYTQTDIVVVTDSLDSLKPDLVVTALWSNGSTTTIGSNEYTLSGTLEGGSSTITATYSGKTDTFTVTVAAPPSGYTAYETISYTGTESKLTDRNVLMPTKTYGNLNRVSFDFKFKSSAVSGSCIFGGRTASGSTSSFAFYSNSGVLGYHIHGADSSVSIAATSDVNRVIYTATTATPSTIDVNGTSYNLSWSNDNTINTFLSMFTNQQTGVNAVYLKTNIKVGRIIAKDTSGNVTQIYIPCKRTADNVIGLYDTVEEQFYTCGSANYATVGGSGCVYVVGDWT